MAVILVGKRLEFWFDWSKAIYSRFFENKFQLSAGYKTTSTPLAPLLNTLNSLTFEFKSCWLWQILLENLPVWSEAGVYSPRLKCSYHYVNIWNHEFEVKYQRLPDFFFLRLANSSTYFKSKGYTRRGRSQFLGNVITICSLISY